MKRIYLRFIERLSVRHLPHDQSLYTLSPDELKRVKGVERRGKMLSALIAIVMVLLLYIPQYIFTDFFGEKPWEVPFTLLKISISWMAIGYSVILLIIEIFLLTFLHLYCAHEVAVATGLIVSGTQKHPTDLEILVAIGMEKKDKSMSSLGLNPYQGLSNSAIIFRNVLIALKATLTNVLIKLLARNVFGEYASRAVLDMLGIPIFAFWNGWATHLVLREARLVIMGKNFIQLLSLRLPDSVRPEHHDLIYDTLQFIAVSKRDYHRNHLYLSRAIFEKYKIPVRNKHHVDETYDERLRKAPPEVQQLCRMLIVLGFLLDGSLSVREYMRAEQLREDGVIDIDNEQLRNYRDDFVDGRGLESLMQRYLGTTQTVTV